MKVIYEFFRCVGLISAWPLQLLFFKRKTYYEDKRAQSRFVKGGALVISNHFHVYDFMMNLFLFPFRKLHVVYWSQDGQKQSPFIKQGMKFFGGIASNRDAMSMSFIDESVKVLEKGGLVQIYPEAHITLDGEMDHFKPSYVLIALRANVPIIPVMIDGNYGITKQSHVLIGKPIDLWDYCTSDDPTREEIEAMNELVYQRAAALRLELLRRIEEEKRPRRRKGETK